MCIVQVGAYLPYLASTDPRGGGGGGNNYGGGGGGGVGCRV